MKTLTINIPDGKITKQTSADGSITITFEDEKPKSIMDKVKTVNDAYLLASDKAKARYDKFKEAVILGLVSSDNRAYEQLILIASVLNEGWIPNWDDKKEYKWHPWFNLSSGFGFVVSYYNCTASRTYAGSRLCFKSEELSTYAGKHFTNLYEEFLTIK